MVGSIGFDAPDLIGIHLVEAPVTERSRLEAAAGLSPGTRPTAYASR
jgi:hypothetical protein